MIQSALGISIAALLYIYQSSRPNDDKIFDAPRFATFTITSREDVSPTAFILTLRPNAPFTPDQDPYAAQWDRGIWSVEFKQPQLQIARSYTPLPPTKTTKAGDLRFYIRKEKGGEVSNYVAGLPVGGSVQLRGPHPGVDLTGDIKQVVFMAGGTGIAPALQVAHTLLVRRGDGERPKIKVVWANQKWEECVGGYEHKNDEEAWNPIVKELEALQRKYPDRLEVYYVVDGDKKGVWKQPVDQKKVFVLPKNETQVKYGAVTMRIDSKLIFVSGPEGFVDHLAGPKKWEDGKETQGEVGGLLGRKGMKDWKVWKL
jgi:NAD(P)H-flavin reductase